MNGGASGKVTTLPGVQQPQAKPARACERCEFYKAVDGEYRGECRRRPPVLVVHLDDAPDTCFPRMKPGDWCGTFVEAQG